MVICISISFVFSEVKVDLMVSLFLKIIHSICGTNLDLILFQVSQRGQDLLQTGWWCSLVVRCNIRKIFSQSQRVAECNRGCYALLLTLSASLSLVEAESISSWLLMQRQAWSHYGEHSLWKNGYTLYCARVKCLWNRTACTCKKDAPE